MKPFCFSYATTHLLIVLCLLLTASPVITSASASAEVVEKVMAIVNKKAIYLSDVKKFKKNVGLRAKIDPLYSTSPISKKSNTTDAEIVNYMVDEEVIVQKFPVNDVDLNAEITTIETNLKIDRAGLKQAIQNEGYSFDDYYKIMRTSLAKRQLIDREIRSRAAVTDDDVKNEYRKSQFSTKTFQGSFHLFVIRLQTKNYKSFEAAKEIAQGAYKSIQSGQDFQSIAKTVSDDSTATEGGDLGFISFSDLSTFLQSSVRKLEVGKVSSVLEDKPNNQLYLLKITEIRSAMDNEFEAEKEKIRARLMDYEIQHQITLWLEKQRTLNFIKII
jgi:foldase protein PrsA